MPSTRDLMTAISDGNLDRVQEILIERDPQGIPRVDINRGFGNAETALLLALWCNPINELIVQTLLDVRDNANNPVSDINHKGAHGRTALSCVLSREIEPNLRRRLLQRILDVRGANGELVTDVTADECNIPLLKQAQELSDTHCFRILQNARTSTGAFALDINEIRHETTVLDSALKDGIYYRRDQTMIETIQQLGGLRTMDVPPLVRQAQEVRRQQQRLQPPMVPRQEHRVHQQPPMNGNQHQEAHHFINNSQNTHQSEVTISVAASIKRLKIRYPEINILETLQEIRNFLTQLPDSNTKKAYAINCLDRIERDPTEHALSNGTKLSQALALVWTGIKDQAALVEGLEEFTEQDVECRKSTLIDNLFQAKTEYGHGGVGVSACFVGTLNKIIETLDRSHPDVTIITGASNILPIATERARIIVRDELKKKSPREQRKILKSWDDPDPDNGKTIATEFRENMVEIASSLLEEEFQQLLTKSKRDEITGQFEYLPRPTLHEQLDKLINTINQLHDNDNQSRQAAIVRVKEQANNSYEDTSKTFSEIHISLKDLLEDTVDEILDEFENKIDTVGIHYIDAKLKAFELLNTLKNYKNEALKTPSTESLSLFAGRSKEAIKDATPILQRDLGWGDYLVNLAKQLINAVTTAVACVATLGASNHHGFFVLKPSDAVNKSQELAQAIQSFSIR